MPTLAFVLASKRELAPVWCVFLTALLLVMIGLGNLYWSRTNEKRFIPAVAAFIMAGVVFIIAVIRWLA